ncbi:MAG: hypothetical protein HWQ35_15980 [Nostoc sp. NMS1]|nr:hypothetical protein [Nostoc sp. NMS2]MBN3907993.1 hypothetical protein [Nostoc sp. NMS1]MBN3990622.1 hypothetical protein [Nostoc sp. NMS2]
MSKWRGFPHERLALETLPQRWFTISNGAKAWNTILLTFDFRRAVLVH